MKHYIPQAGFEIEQDLNPDRKIPSITLGRLIKWQETDDIELVDDSGNRWELDAVSFSSQFAGALEGRFRFPRPRIVDSDGVMVEDGDILLIGFANSNLANPVILATVFPITTLDDFRGTDPEKHVEHRSSERRSYDDVDAGDGNFSKAITFRRFNDNNETEDVGSLAYSITENGDIEIDLSALKEEGWNGNITLEISGTKDNGNISLESNGNVILNLLGDTDGDKGDLDLSSVGDITITLTGSTEDKGNISITISGDAALESKQLILKNERTEVNSVEVLLGEGAEEPLLKGQKWWDLFVNHTHPTDTGITGRPISSGDAEGVLSEQNKTK